MSPGPVHVSDVLISDPRYQRIMARWRSRGPAPWWVQPEHPNWAYLLQILAPLTNVVTISDSYIAAHPIEFDQMIREWRTCQQCNAKKPQTDAEGRPYGYRDCPLEEIGMRNVYLGIVAYPETDTQPARWEWVGRHCTTKEARGEEIAERLGQFADVGGIAGVMIGDGEQPNGGAAR